MPPKSKKKRASLKLTPAGVEAVEEAKQPETEPSVRQVVEVVEEENIPEAIDTIKRDAAEIEDVAQSIEEEVIQSSEVSPAASGHEEVSGDEKLPKPKDAVESLFADESSRVTPEITVVGKKDRSLAIWVGAILGIALAIGASLVFLVKGPSAFSLSFAFPKSVPTPTPTIAPTPTPSVAVDKKNIKVRVLNGGGVAGAGAKMKSFLEEKGYTVTGVANADSYTYDQTIVTVKAGNDAYIKLLVDDLKADYSLSSSPAGSVADDASYDAQVIVGKE